MLKIFAFCALFLCGGCLAPDAGQEDPDTPISEARRLCRENMLELRTAENWQKIRGELRKQTLQIAIPGRLSRLTGTDGTHEEARQALYLAQLYLQELTAPDTAAARRLLARRSEELLDLEFDILTARLLAGEREAAALKEACAADPQATVPATALRRAQAALETDRMEMRTLLGLPAGTAFRLKPDEADPAFPTANRLETALACREELRDSPFTPAELAAAVRAAAGGTAADPVRRAFDTALTLLRVPRELYRRELAGQTELAGMRELLTALGIGAELALAEAETEAAKRALETAGLFAGNDPRSRAEQARAEGHLAAAQAHLAAAIGGKTPYSEVKRQTEPPEKLLNLLSRLEKYRHE